MLSSIGICRGIPIFKLPFVTAITFQFTTKLSYLSNNEATNFSTDNAMLLWCSTSTTVSEKFCPARFNKIFPTSLPYWALFIPITCCLHRYRSKSGALVVILVSQRNYTYVSSIRTVYCSCWSSCCCCCCCWLLSLLLLSLVVLYSLLSLLL